MACDAADAAAGVLAGRRGELSKLSTVLVTAPALAGVRSAPPSCATSTRPRISLPSHSER